MKQRIFSLALSLCLSISSPLAAYAGQDVPLPQETALAEEAASEQILRDGTIPTPSEVYASMIALKDQDAYKEGTTWTDYEPYSDSNGCYSWNGGPLDGKNIRAVGCVAFAFILSDAAFGKLPARMYAEGQFTFDNIKVGDILRLNTDTHTVIVLETNDVGVVVAEGNYSGKVHWGRAISKEVVMRDTSHYITRYPEGYVAPDDPEANVSIANGVLDGGLTWNLTKAGTLTVSGKGAMPDFSGYSEQPWNKNSGQIRTVVIENGVTSVGSCAFWNCGVLNADIASSVITIGNSAFRSSSIISVTIPSSVKTIGDSAFRDCQYLNSVNFSEGLETIVQNAFRSCVSLSSINLPASIGEVGAGAFFQCTSLISASFAPGSKQVTLGDNLFTQCYYLIYVTLPQKINCIGEGMFQNCQMLTGLEIPQGAESIGGSAFASCYSFTTVIIPDSVTSIGIAAFSACPLSDIYYAGTEAQWNSIGKIGDTAAAVSRATIHYNYTPAVPDNSETGNTNSENSNGSENNDASENNGGSETSADSENGGSSETGESQKPEQKPFEKGHTFTVRNITYKVTKVGKEVALTASKSTAAKITVNTVTGKDGVNYKVTSIGSKAMQNSKKLTTLTIGANVKTIGANAFSDCKKLTTVTFGKNVTKIGKSAFSGCKKLGKVTIQSTKLTSIGNQAFKGAKSSLKVKVPSKKLKNYKKLLKKAGLTSLHITT